MVLKFLDFPFRLIAAHLFIERIEKLLAGRGAAKGGAVIERSAEPAKIEIPLWGAVEGAAEPIHHPDDAGGGKAHLHNRRLVGQKISPFDRIVGMDQRRVVFIFEIHRSIDAALARKQNGSV